jgi:hypothetical protein
MMGRWLSIAAIALLAAGCEDGAPETNTIHVRAANPISDQMKGMSELYRYLSLRRAIVDSGQRCKKVDRGAYQQEYKTMAMWTAHCTDSGDWAVFIAPNADVQVRRCGNLSQLELPACRLAEPPRAS